MKFTNSQLSILELIKSQQKISRKELAKSLNLTLPAITKSLKPLLEKRIILNTEFSNSTGGRKSTLLSINSKWIGKILGLSLTPTYIHITIGDINGKIDFIKKTLIPIDIDLVRFIEILITERLKENLDIQYISLAFTGMIDSEKGIILFCPHQTIKDLNIKHYLEKRFNLPIFIENDVKAMALAERYFGTAINCKNFVVLNVSEGIGCAIYSNDNLFTGVNFTSGEIGHIVINRNSLRRCSCGKKGCLEAEASEKAILKELVSKIKLNNFSLLKKTLIQKGNLDIFDILAGVKNRDSLTINIASEAMIKIAHAIDIIISLINPEKIILIGNIFTDDFLYSILKIEIQNVTLKEQNYLLEFTQIWDKIHNYNSLAIVRDKIFKQIGGLYNDK